MFEIPFILKWIKGFRLISLFAAVIYNLLFLVSIFDFFYLADVEEKDLLEDQGWGDMFMALFIFYNLIENAPIVLINAAIIIKESILPFFQLVTNTKAPRDEDKIQLSLIDFSDTFWFLTNLFNPAAWARNGFKFAMGWDPVDTVIENKNDEKHYYTGKTWTWFTNLFK